MGQNFFLHAEQFLSPAILTAKGMQQPYPAQQLTSPITRRTAFSVYFFSGNASLRAPCYTYRQLI